ncbi:PWWP domain-containing protein 2A-like [Saccoglossus kowalevskii]
MLGFKYKMASSAMMEGVKKGVEVGVQIEEALEDLLVVSFHHGRRIFRGVLLDTSKRDGPFGIPSGKLSSLKAEMNFETDRQNLGQTVQIDNNPSENGKRWEHSAISFRQTYGQNLPIPAPRPILKPNKIPSKDIKNKYQRTRHIRLRPRQALCSKCKGAVNPNSVVGPRTCKTAAKPATYNTTQTNTPKVQVRKRKAVATNGKPKDTKRMKMKRRENKVETQTITKTSPLIKISFATPHGKGRVIKIPPRTHTTIKPSNSSRLNHNNHKKALKKTNDTFQLKRSTPSLMNGVHVKLQNCMPRTMSTGKETKHKSKNDVVDKTHNTPIVRQPYVPYDFEDSDSESMVSSDRLAEARTTMSKPYVDTSNNRLILRTSKFKTKEVKEKKSLSHVLASLPTQRNKNSEDSVISISSTSDQSATSSQSPSVRSSIGTDHYDFAVVPCSEKNVEQGLEQENKPRPALTVRIHKKNVTKCTTETGKTTCVGDIVWGKIQGFPWWPGRVISITVSRNDTGTVFNQEARIAWFASSTTSSMSCAQLHPYLDSFQKRHKKKKRGPYREAIKEASQACKDLSREVKQLNTMFEVS